ncbi:hypothetical protein DV738_g2666, partial [Chaetothyriales sp. CBS 135597]
MSQYNQQYNYQQHTPGPTQPAWQAPPRRSGWADPRLQSPQQAPVLPAAPIRPPSVYPPPPPQSPAPQVPQYDTSTWGVKYNQSQAQPQTQIPPNDGRPRPQLPPRPPSAVAFHGAPTAAAAVTAAPSAPSNPQAYTGQQPPYWQDPYGSQQQDFPLTSPVPSSHIGYDNGPVSPIESEHNPGSRPTTTPGPPAGNTLHATRLDSQPHASAPLGIGQPPEWEHFYNANPTAPPLSPELATATNAAHAAHAAHIPASSPPPIPGSYPPHHETPPAHHLSNEANDQDARPASTTTPLPQQGINRTGTIDSVIDAWNQPLNISAQPPHIQHLEKQSEVGQPPASAPPSQPHQVEKIVEKVVDPYSDLPPEFKASLNRYVAMLRKEAAADTDEARFEHFESFVRKELRLRSLLYGIEPHLQDLHSSPKSNALQSPAKVDAIRPEAAPESHFSEPQTKELPLSEKKVVPEPVRSDTPSAVAQVEAPHTSQDGQWQDLSNTAVKKQSAPITPALPPLKTASASSVAPERLEAAESDPEYSPGGRPLLNRQHDDVQFSPGGRPIMPRPRVTTQIPEKSHQMSDARQEIKASPSANAPMVLDDYLMAQPPSPSANAPIVMESSVGKQPQEYHAGARLDATGFPLDNSSKAAPPLKFEPPRPAYEPFKYNANVQPPTQPANQSYSSLRKDATESSRLLAHEPVNNPQSSPDSDSRTRTSDRQSSQDGNFIGLIKAHSQAVQPSKSANANLAPIPQLRAGTPNAGAATGQAPASRESALGSANRALRSILPTSVPERYGLSKHAKARALRDKIGGFSDDFGFIRETVIAWDRKNREVRKKLEEERSARQAEPESHVDGLYHDNEIGYADIRHLEAEFKLHEAERRYKEDQAELESFSKGVYEPVTGRIKKEIFELDNHYALAVQLLESDAVAASQYLRADQGKSEMGFVMNCALSAFQKLEIRHKKVAEADVERERRRKRLELTVLYTNGDIQGVKKLEQEFAAAEKMQVLHEARSRDRRANSFMDTVDRATLRGLGDNQTYLDDLLARIRPVKEIVLKDASNIPQEVYAPEGPRDSLSLAQRTIDYVLTDSQKLLGLSNVADKLLNDADYSVSVAEAHVSNADQVTYQRLEEEKAKEDAKILNDTNSRLSSIGKTPEAAIALIREVVDKVGDDPEHQERIKKALEAAKQRNTEPGSSA